jgi:hypothetical protein
MALPKRQCLFSEAFKHKHLFVISDETDINKLNISQWIHPLNYQKCMPWVTLRKSHFWENVHKSLEFRVKKKIILSESVDEIGLIHEYWVSKHITTNTTRGWMLIRNISAIWTRRLISLFYQTDDRHWLKVLIEKSTALVKRYFCNYKH